MLEYPRATHTKSQNHSGFIVLSGIKVHKALATGVTTRATLPESGPNSSPDLRLEESGSNPSMEKFDKANENAIGGNAEDQVCLIQEALLI